MLAIPTRGTPRGVQRSRKGVKKNETDPISHNQQGINGLQSFPYGAAAPAQQKLSRSFHRDARRHRPNGRRPEKQQQGNNELSQQRTSPAMGATK